MLFESGGSGADESSRIRRLQAGGSQGSAGPSSRSICVLRGRISCGCFGLNADGG
jgi:hypothetical protein